MRSLILEILVGFIALNFQNLPLRAALVTIDVEGVVRSLSTNGGLNLDDSAGIGSIMTGSFTYDTDSPNQSTYPYLGKYSMISISMTIGNYTFTHNSESPTPPLFRIYMVDPGYIASSSNVSFDGTIYVNGLPKNYEDMFWSWTYLDLINVWTSSGKNIPLDVLPDSGSFPNLSVFDNRKEFWVSFYEPYAAGQSGFDIRGELTSLTVEIPEPNTVLLLGLGSLAMLRKRKA